MNSPTRQSKRKASRRGEQLPQDIRVLRDFIGQFIAEVDGLNGETVLRVHDNMPVTCIELTNVQAAFRSVAAKALNLTPTKP